MSRTDYFAGSPTSRARARARYFKRVYALRATIGGGLMRPTDCGRDQTVHDPDVIYDEFAPVTLAASSMVCSFRQMFLDQYPLLVREEQGATDLNL